MPELSASNRARLPNGAFAYVDLKGNRRLPINDEPHVRNALARFEQVAFEDAAAKERARNRLLVAAKKYGIVPIGFIAGQLRAQTLDAKGRKRRLPSGTVTLLLTDIERSTELLRQLGDAYGSVLDDHRGIIRSAVTAAGGHEVDARADEFFAVFEIPRSALEAAVSIQRLLATHVWPGGAALRICAGIHTGKPLFLRTDYVGLPVHTAARISAAGHGGQILLSSASHAALVDGWPDGFGARSMGTFVLRGLVEPEEVFQVTGSDLPDDFPALKLRHYRPRRTIAR